MPFLVQDLIDEHQQVCAVPMDTSVRAALDLMSAHRYSQLPVVTDSEKPIGMVTAESILKALDQLPCSVDDLRVSHAVAEVRTFRTDNDLFYLLDYLRDSYAALVVDANDRLKSIVTNFDTAEYFRRRAEDMMYVEDIEATIRDRIRPVYANEHGELNPDLLPDIIDAQDELFRQFRAGLVQYLSLQGAKKPNLHTEHAKEAFDKAFKAKKSSKSLEELSLFESSELLLQKDNWDNFRDIFGLDPEPLRRILDGVRKTRNKLAHFRGEITDKQREQLRYCAGLLTRHQPRTPVPAAMMAEVAAGIPNDAALEPVAISPVGAPPPTQLRTSRYESLTQYLTQQPSDRRLLRLTFEQVEKFLGEPLPESARNHRAWWSNDSNGHTQASHWLGAGWQVLSLDMPGETVFLRRSKS